MKYITVLLHAGYIKKEPTDGKSAGSTNKSV